MYKNEIHCIWNRCKKRHEHKKCPSISFQEIQTIFPNLTFGDRCQRHSSLSNSSDPYMNCCQNLAPYVVSIINVTIRFLIIFFITFSLLITFPLLALVALFLIRIRSAFVSFEFRQTLMFNSDEWIL